MGARALQAGLRMQKPAVSAPMSVESHGETHVGRKRRQNQDQFLIADLSKSMLIRQTSLPRADQPRIMSGVEGKLFAVADGMGGHASGEVASQLAIRTVTEFVLNTMPWFFQLDAHGEDDLSEVLKAGLERCQAALTADSALHPSHSGMGTTLTLAYVLAPAMYVVHAGDSRCYILRGGDLRQITKDHTLAQRMVEAGTLAPEQADHSDFGHVLYNAIIANGTSELRPEVYKAVIARGDQVLLCSDGLTLHVSNQEIARILSRAASAEEACRRLVEQANEMGGRDNITAVVARFT